MHVSADHVIEAFQTATEENQMYSLRQQQVVTLPAEGDFWITGDIHDHRRNFDKVVKAADLGSHPQRHLLLQELIHGDYFEADGSEASWRILFRAAELKCDFPQQVHFLLANHDLAQIHGEGIMKAGLSVCEAFNAGVEKEFKTKGHIVLAAISEFLLSFPLAVRTPGGIFCSHSMPTEQQLPQFDYDIFNRELMGPDYARRVGPVYQLIWGRNIAPAAVAQFAQNVGAKVVITGHQPQESGFAVNGPQHLIIASDHNQGVFLVIDPAREYEMASLVKRLKKFAAIP